MALVRWEPVRELNSLQCEMNRLFNTFFDTPTTAGNGGAAPLDPLDGSRGDRDALRAPGRPARLGEGDVSIELDDNVLTVSGERKVRARGEAARDSTASSARSATFRRSLTLPDGVDADAIAATFDKGVLEVRIPKPEERKPRRVEIKVGDATPAIEGSESTVAPPRPRRVSPAGPWRHRRGPASSFRRRPPAGGPRPPPPAGGGARSQSSVSPPTTTTTAPPTPATFTIRSAPAPDEVRQRARSRSPSRSRRARSRTGTTGHDIRLTPGQPRGRDPQPGDPASEEHRLRPVALEERLARRRSRGGGGARAARGRAAAAVRTVRPIANPTLSPRIAAAAATTITSSMFRWPLDARIAGGEQRRLTRDRDPHRLDGDEDEQHRIAHVPGDGQEAGQHHWASTMPRCPH